MYNIVCGQLDFDLPNFGKDAKDTQTLQYHSTFLLTRRFVRLCSTTYHTSQVSFLYLFMTGQNETIDLDSYPSSFMVSHFHKCEADKVQSIARVYL